MTCLENQTGFHQQQKLEMVAHHHSLYSDQRRPRQQPKIMSRSSLATLGMNYLNKETLRHRLQEKPVAK